MQDIVKYNEKRGELALWEQKTDANIKKNEVRKRYEAIMAQAESQLEERRGRLQAKLLDEQRSLQQELDAQRVSPAEYRKMRAEKARKLAEARDMTGIQLLLIFHGRDRLELAVINLGRASLRLATRLHCSRA